MSELGLLMIPDNAKENDMTDGNKIVDRLIADGYMRDIAASCPRCGGTGENPEWDPQDPHTTLPECPTCGGTGKNPTPTDAETRERAALGLCLRCGGEVDRLGPDPDLPRPRLGLKPGLLTEGARVALTRNIERFPHFRVAEGAEGTVTEATEDLVCVRMDDHVPGAEEWDNEVCWMPEDEYPGPQRSATRAAARDLRAASPRAARGDDQVRLDREMDRLIDADGTE